jgi:DNA-binding GntR family transcriptional regulator
MLLESIVAGDSAQASEVMCAHIDTSLGATAIWRLGHDGTGD